MCNARRKSPWPRARRKAQHSRYSTRAAIAVIPASQACPHASGPAMRCDYGSILSRKGCWLRRAAATPVAPHPTWLPCLNVGNRDTRLGTALHHVPPSIRHSLLSGTAYYYVRPPIKPGLLSGTAYYTGTAYHQARPTKAQPVKAQPVKAQPVKAQPTVASVGVSQGVI